MRRQAPGISGIAHAGGPGCRLDTPGDTLILSDIEGNLRFLDGALASLAVTDAKGNWAYGRNHLVIAGDMVDRGRDVFAVLWRLYALSLQAQDAGGAVHLLLGDHEQYLLRGNTSRADRDRLYALTRLGGQARAFGPNTLIGHWRRLQPVIIKSGRTVRYWSGDMPGKAELDAALGPAGLTRYRGYLEDGEERFARATAAQVDEILEHFGARSIVVGHTLVEA